jgi:hypothetical protein
MNLISFQSFQGNMGYSVHIYEMVILGGTTQSQIVQRFGYAVLIRRIGVPLPVWEDFFSAHVPLRAIISCFPGPLAPFVLILRDPRVTYAWLFLDVSKSIASSKSVCADALLIRAKVDPA